MLISPEKYVEGGGGGEVKHPLTNKQKKNFFSTNPAFLALPPPIFNMYNMQ